MSRANPKLKSWHCAQEPKWPHIESQENFVLCFVMFCFF